jgi:hypothetical protein
MRRWIGFSVLLALGSCSSAPGGGDAGGGLARAADHPPPAPPSLLVRGRITPDSLVLEPVFRIDVPASPRSAAEGGHRVIGYDAGGRVLFDAGLETAAPAGTPGEEHFSVVLPLPEEQASRITRVDLRSADGRRTSREALLGFDQLQGLLEDPNTARVERRADGYLRIRWAGHRLPYLLVRDAATGALLSFATGYETVVATNATSIDLVLSDGVRSGTVRVSVP